jgi:3-hydroxybutyryl-CoA dehydratase
MTQYPSFHQLEVGQQLSGRITVTEAHIVLACGIFADFAPLHVDEEYARQTRFGTRIAHGTLITGIMAGVLSKHLGPNAVGYLEQNVRFTAPVLAGDTVSTVWEITEKVDKPRLGGGIVTLRGTCSTQAGVTAVEGTSALIVAYGTEPVTETSSN